MNEQLQTAVSQLIEKSLNGVDTAAAFIQSELPDYVYQLLLWYGVKSAIVGLVYLLISALWFWYGIIKPVKIIMDGTKSKKATIFTDRDGDVSVISALLSFNVFLLAPFLGSFNNLLEALQIWIAPKVWLLEYASTLVK